MELNRCDFHGCLKDIVECNDVRVTEVKDQHIGIKWLAENFNTIIKTHEFNQRHRNEMFFSWMEFYAGNRFVFTVLLLLICAGYQVYWTIFACCGGLFIPEHFKIILKDIDNFIWLESLLNSVLNAIDKLVQLVINVTTTCRLISNFIDEVFWIVLDAGVNWSIDVGLGLQSLNWVCCLETHR